MQQPHLNPAWGWSEVHSRLSSALPGLACRKVLSQRQELGRGLFRRAGQEQNLSLKHHTEGRCRGVPREGGVAKMSALMRN